MKLAEHFEAHAAEAAFWLLGLLADEAPLLERGALSEQVSGSMRVHGILSLLVHGDSDAFYHCLIRSALARKVYLDASVRTSELNFHNAVSRSGAVFDALAAKAYQLVKDLSVASPKEWMPAGEYEDDFYFSHFFHIFPLNPEATSTIEPILAGFEEALGGDEAPELDVCRALYTRQQSAFDEAFQSLLEKRTIEIEDDMARGQLIDVDVYCQRNIYVEGLAILNVAERLGFELQDEYLYCPSLARMPMSKQFDWQKPFGF